MNDNNLNDFKSYITSKSAVNEKYAPYYVRWVSSCYAFVNQSLSDALTNGQKQDFLKHFAKNHEDWQVNQADNALRLYGYFLSSEHPDKATGIPETLINDWKVVEEKTIEAIRLRRAGSGSFLQEISL